MNETRIAPAFEPMSGPALPMALFTSTSNWNPERIHALALYCSDGRWGEACDEFCQRRLSLPRYDRLAVPGGPAWIVPSDSSSHDLQKIIRGHLAFLVQKHELEKLILIAHYGCAYYTEWLQRTPEECLEQQMADLRTGAGLLREWFAGIKVETYLATRRENLLTFHSVDSSDTVFICGIPFHTGPTFFPNRP